jgi:hypothetical protein
MVLFASFAIDTAHWWDYSRNLQNRADAAALAAGDRLAICLGSSNPPVRGIGETAEQYSGPPSNTPDNLANIPYFSAQMATDGFTPYYNVPNLTSGKGPEGGDFHLLLNSSQYWPAVAQNGPNGYGDMGSFCTASDPTDPTACPAASAPGGCPIVDVRLTQGNVPMFFNLLGFHPNISAHARVELETVSGSGLSSPIGVGDAGQAGCVVARIVDETNQNAGPNGNGVLAQWQLNQQGTSTTWSGAMTGNLSIPNSNGAPDRLGLQAVLPADCSNPFGAGAVWDAPSNGPNAGFGIAYINTYTPLNPPVAAPTRGSVWLVGGTCTSGATNDPYFYSFKSGTCPVAVNAQVDFPTPPAGQTYGVSVSEDGGAYTAMTPNGTDGSGNTLWQSNAFMIQPQSGKHTFALSWYLAGGNGTCKTASDGSKPGCQFDGGSPVQRTMSAFDDGTGIDDSGPVIAAGIGCIQNVAPPSVNSCPVIGGGSTAGATSGTDSIPGTGSGSSPQLTATFTLQGLAESGPTDKASVLRSSVQSSGRTGIFDCGQGGSGSGFTNLMLGGGCGTYVTPNGTTTSALQDYSGPLNSWANCIELPSNPISCGAPVTGNMRGPVHDTIATLICGDSKCQSTPSGKACDYWQPYKAGTGPLPNAINDPNDPRAIEMVITSPQDLALSPNDPRWIRILGFATFYVTGWDGDPYIAGSGTTIPGCAAVGGTPTNVDEPYPYGTTPNNAVWGHFIQYVFPGQGSQGNPCIVGQPFACTPALTR